ncbi:MAG: PIN domain-containing protein, partial [Candidatus Riflebacteria bacterium]|nr:PIN domain-containing protein [Candidatus Riflebacteria bacterium]
MKVLVDTSVWVEFLRGGPRAVQLDAILAEGFPATNELILAELIPALRLKKQKKLIKLLQEQHIFHLKPVWS